MPQRWQTHDRLFDVNAPKWRRNGKDMPVTPQPGQPLRWCAHDRKLLARLARPAVLETFGQAAQAYIRQLQAADTVTLEQAAWLRARARKVTFRGTNGTDPGRGVRFDEL